MNFKPLLLALAATLSISAAQAQSLSLTPSTKSVKVGDTFSIDVVADGFANPITGGGFNLEFAPTILRLDSVSVPSSWFFRSGGLIDAASGTVSDVSFGTISSPPSGTFLTATLNFSAIAEGTSALKLMASGPQPFFEDLAQEPLPVSFRTGSITVTSVPEPSSIALALAGVLLVRLTSARRQTRG
jgi:hypothetical protein